MKLKFLLLFVLIANFVWAQEPYKGLVITEAMMIKGNFNNCYLEITNMGESSIDLSEIKFCKGHGPVEDVTNPRGWVYDSYFFLPQSVTKVLQPGESYVITIGLDYALNHFKARTPEWGFGDRAKNHGIYQYADFIAHREEASEEQRATWPHIKDSTAYFPDPVTGVIDSTKNWNDYVFGIGHLCNLANKAIWLEHHYTEGDSAVIDQVKGRFEDDNFTTDGDPDDVAGVTDATDRSILVRKSTIKQGNLDFDATRGTGIADSDWLPLVPPENKDNWREIWWTVGNHGDYVLDENTLKPQLEGLEVDFAGNKITVPWGVRRLDGIMRNMEYTEGVAWIYHLNSSREDSLLRSVQTGDKLTVYVVGETLYEKTFDIEVKDPTPADNIVIPVDHVNLENTLTGGPITENAQHGKLSWPRVTNHENGPDSIWAGGYGLPHALRADSLLKYLEKPEKASWEFIFIDGVEKRADLKTGDILKVTADNGDEREYFIEVQGYTPSHNNFLSSITWPDISLNSFERAIYGWNTKDTIPNFNTTTTAYRLTMPSGIEGIPALVAKTQDLNASVAVDGATDLLGGVESRTNYFHVTAEDDTSVLTYTVELFKEKNPEDVQPYTAEPFLSEYVTKLAGNNSYAEICNPGTEPIDLSNYMFVQSGGTNPAEVITDEGNWNARYKKWVPGYTWGSEADWNIQSRVLKETTAYQIIVQPGDVYVFGTIWNDGHSEGMDWPLLDELDVQFVNREGNYGTYVNSWGEDVPQNQTPVAWVFGQNLFMFKILNDSVKSGDKPATDPSDFELIEYYGNPEGGKHFVAGQNQTQSFRTIRKPEFARPNPQSSFGTNEEDSEWIVHRESDFSGSTSEQRIQLESDLGQHFYNTPTGHMSTVSSSVYKVTRGWKSQPPQEIHGIVTGTVVSDFIANIVKANEGQTLTLKSDGAELDQNDVLSNADTLVVLSADSSNTTRYLLEVTEDGLRSNAVLTSDLYDIEIETEPKSASDEHDHGAGTISGFEFGTLLKTVKNNVIVPGGASMNIVDNTGAFIPFKKLNFDTSYVDVTVNTNTYFDVLAEDGVTRIIYQLLPEASQSDAFITSDVYDVTQKELLISFVPRETNVRAFLSNVVPSTGASMKLVDKFGLERTYGHIVEDDKLVVTSPDGTNTKVYYLSMLRTRFIQETTYLAYILSDIYSVDQVDYRIDGVSGSLPVSDFYNSIEVASGATAVLVDENGAEKTSGDIDGSDKVKVTSADGAIEVMYSFGQLTGAEDLQVDNQIEIYPNPTSGQLNVRGVDPGNRIRVFNSTGALIYDVNVRSSIETFSLNNQPAGMYLIVVSDKSQLLGRFKAFRK
jgi:hypothetical protein